MIPPHLQERLNLIEAKYSTPEGSTEEERSEAQRIVQLKSFGPPCRVCGKTEPVLCYPDDHSQTICPECCDKATHADDENGHIWYYDRDERQQVCDRCGIPKSCTKYAFDRDYD